MAGFFGLFDFTKPGKGVDKDTPPKRPFFLFFELLWRKLGRLILTNILFFLFLLPLLTAACYILYAYLFAILAHSGEIISDYVPPLLPGFLITIVNFLPGWLSYVLLGISAVLYGPVSCGMAYILRNIARQEHAWFSDFFGQIKKNFKQGLVLGLLDLALLSALIYNISLVQNGSLEGLLSLVPYTSAALLIIYLFMRNYLFTMCVTFNLKVRQMLKNALILSGLGLWRNFLTLIINGVLFFAVFYFGSFVELAATPLLLFSLTGFVAMFVCYPVVNKYLMPATSEPDTE